MKQNKQMKRPRRTWKYLLKNYDFWLGVESLIIFQLLTEAIFILLHIEKFWSIFILLTFLVILIVGEVVAWKEDKRWKESNRK